MRYSTGQPGRPERYLLCGGGQEQEGRLLVGVEDGAVHQAVGQPQHQRDPGRGGGNAEEVGGALRV